MTRLETITDPKLDLREAFEKSDLLGPGQNGKLGAHVGGGNPLIPLLRDFVVPSPRLVVPSAVHRSYYGFLYGMLGNDRYGDCVFAEIYHAIQHSRKVVGRTDVPVGDDALAQCALQGYSEVTGFNQNDPSTDQGTDPVAAYAWHQQKGAPLPDGTRDKIAGVVQVAPSDGVNVRRGIYEFDVAALSLSMPIAWQPAAIWDVGGDPQSDPNWQPGGWGGHEVGAVSFDARRIAVMTWGGIKLLTWPALGTYGTLVIFRVSQDQIGSGGTSETGVDLTALGNDLPQL